MRNLATRLGVGAVAVALVAAATAASAETLRWARSGDSLTLDPHAQNEGPTHTLAHQIYEPLLHRDMAGQITPGLATGWKALADNPTFTQSSVGTCRRSMISGRGDGGSSWPRIVRRASLQQ